MYRRHTYRADIAGPTWLYRLYGGTSLVYVGVSSDPAKRLVSHRRKQSWWNRITSVDLVWFPSRAAAFEAERAAILNEAPSHNIARPRGATV